MKIVAVVVSLLYNGAACAGEMTCSKPMPSAVESKLLPVLDALRAAAAKSDWWDKGYAGKFQALLDAKDSASSEARVALMDYYVGEAYGEELVCAVALDGARSKSILQRYSKCDVTPSRSPVPRKHDGVLRGYALKMINDGDVVKSCTFN